jgi:hypothetical protein
MSDPHDNEGIKVTEEMIVAGCAELASFDRRYESDEDMVERIYRAMVTASVSGRVVGKKSSHLA